LIQTFSSVPVCLDTEGAQVRTGKMAEAVTVSESDRIHLTPQIVLGTSTTIPLTPPTILADLKTNQLITLDCDGVMLLVLSADANGADAVVVNGGKIGSNKAVVISPAPTLEAITDKDRHAIAIGRRMGVKHFALSFTNSAEDVRWLRELTGPDVVIISKIESKRGVANLDEILAEADEILIDRGDLSREVPLENIPLLQKAIIRKANQAKVPVNVATNLLESMIVNRKPTRAELNDIINTLLDGANGLVLAAETAIGQHPVGAVDMVLNLIELFRRSTAGYRIDDLLEGGPSLLPTLHGRKPLASWPSRRQRTAAAIVRKLPGIEVDAETVLDIEHLHSGAYSPLRGFMNRDELETVLNHNRLPTGDAWTMPILLQGKSQEFAAFQPGQSVRLVDSRTARAVAVLQIEDKFELDRESVADRWFGTTDRTHAGVRRFMERGLIALGGSIEIIENLASRAAYELTPAQVRSVFDVKGWTKVVAFHTDGPPRHGWEQTVGQVLEQLRVDGALIHPLIGPRLEGEVPTGNSIQSYEQPVPPTFRNALLAAFPGYRRHAGAREVVFHALCRKNFGCTHFAITSGQSEHYSSEINSVARELFDSLGDVGIIPVFADHNDAANVASSRLLCCTESVVCPATCNHDGSTEHLSYSPAKWW
jgi:ATP sulfurylase